MNESPELTAYIAYEQARKFQEACDREAKKFCTRFEWWLLKKFRNGRIGTWLTGITITILPSYTEINKYGDPQVRIYKTGQVIKLNSPDDD